jgi:hypothetical protein
MLDKYGWIGSKLTLDKRLEVENWDLCYTDGVLPWLRWNSRRGDLLDRGSAHHVKEGPFELGE